VTLLAILVGVAVVFGATAGLVVRRFSALDPADPQTGPGTARWFESRLPGDGPIARLLRSRLDPGAATGLLLTIVVAIFVLFGVLVYQIRSGSGIVRVDRSIARWADTHATTFSRDVLRVITNLGVGWVVFGVGIVMAFVAVRYLNARNAPLFLLIVIGGQSLVTQLIKLGVDRTRPVLGIEAGLHNSFPSGHSASAAATYAACALLLGRGRSPSVRAVLTGSAVAIATAVAASRVLLGLHWFSDVVAGLALGWGWFAIVTLAFGGRLVRFGAPIEAAERHEALVEQVSAGDQGDRTVRPR
jgi:membrane-associated phospholipid phosphatase